MAPPIVLVHGSMDRAASFRRVIAELGDLDVTAYDRRGYGDRVDDTPHSFDDHIDDLLDVIGDRPTIAVGHSLGGTIALAAAVRRPDLIPAVVAFEPPMPWQPWWPADTAGGAAIASSDPAPAAEAFLRRMVGDNVWDRLPESTKAERRAWGPALVVELQGVQTVPVVIPEEVKVPVVLGLGSEGRDHHQRNVRRLAELLPDAEMVIIDGARHGAHLSHPAEFAGLVRRAERTVRRGR